MNTIYDFERCSPPKLDLEEMKKRLEERRLAAPAFALGVFNALFFISVIVAIKAFFGVNIIIKLFVAFCVLNYLSVGAIALALFIRKGDILWQFRTL